MDGDKPQTPGASSSWQFNPSDADAQVPNEQHEAVAQAVTNTESVSWTASEFVAHEKGISWYAALVVCALVLLVLVYVVTKDKITTGIILFTAIAFGVYAKRKPQTLPYHLDSTGLTVGSKFYGYNQFRSFSVIHDGAFSSISFMPLQRFMPVITVYYAPEDEAKIVQILTARLPAENRGRDFIDRFLHRIRF